MEYDFSIWEKWVEVIINILYVTMWHLNLVIFHMQGTVKEKFTSQIGLR